MNITGFKKKLKTAQKIRRKLEKDRKSSPKFLHQVEDGMVNLRNKIKELQNAKKKP